MQYSILLFFQKLSNPVLNFLSEALTMFGESFAVILILLYIYWGVNKNRGFALFITLLSSLTLVNIIKPIFSIERPFVKYPDITGQRVQTATGFSFPSGHTTTAATFYPSLAVSTNHKKHSLLAALILTVLIGLTRLYLGVHYPIDVLTGLVLGLSCTFFLYPLFYKLYENKKLTKISIMLSIINLVVSLILCILILINGELEIYFMDLMKMQSLSFGSLLGFYFDKKYLNFSTSGSIGKKISRYFLGILGLGLIYLTRLIFPQSLYAISSFFRYSMIGYWATFLFPYLAIKFNLMNREF